jgi:hypothetical protein
VTIIFTVFGKMQMFIKLKYKKNYGYLFLYGAVSILVMSLVFGEKFTGFVFFLGFYYLSIIQLNSGIALDRSWTAEYKKEEHPFIFYTFIVLGFVMGTFGLGMLFGS